MLPLGAEPLFPLEVHIRTGAMHRLAQYGIACENWVRPRWDRAHMRHLTVLLPCAAIAHASPPRKQAARTALDVAAGRRLELTRMRCARSKRGNEMRPHPAF